MTKDKPDVGLAWAKLLAIIGQVGAIQGAVNSVMLIGIFYTTTVKPNFPIPIWLYLLIVISVLLGAIIFSLSLGISGYYRFFNQQSSVEKINKKLTLVMTALKIKDDTE